MAGYRTWTDDDDLTSDDLNAFLMGQCVPRFAGTVDRDAQMGGCVEGQLSYVIGLGLAQFNAALGWVPLFDSTGARVTAEGTNARMGVATLAAGTVVVATTAVTATSRIFLTPQSLGTVTAPSALAVSDRTAGASFTILASQATDTSIVGWHILTPA